MSAVTKQEIVEALRQAYDCSVLPFFGPLADRIEQHGIAPQDGWVLVPKEPTPAMMEAAAREVFREAGQQWQDAECFLERTVCDAQHRFYAAAIAAAPEVKP